MFNLNKFILKEDFDNPEEIQAEDKAISQDSTDIAEKSALNNAETPAEKKNVKYVFDFIRSHNEYKGVQVVNSETSLESILSLFLDNAKKNQVLFSTSEEERKALKKEYKSYLISLEDDDEALSYKSWVEENHPEKLTYVKSKLSAQPNNILIFGAAGVGKTGIINNWAIDNDVNLVSVTGSAITNSQFRGINTPNDKGTGFKTLYSTEWDSLNSTTNNEGEEGPGSVLFIDEISTIRPDITSSILTLVQDHTVAFTDENGAHKTKFLPNYLFTIAAANPASEAFGKTTNKLSSAMLTRFAIISFEANLKNSTTYLLGQTETNVQAAKDAYKNNRIPKDYMDTIIAEEAGKKDIVDALAKASELADLPLTFDDEETNVISYNNQRPSFNARTFKSALQACDGTVDSFLDKFRAYCDPAINRDLNGSDIDVAKDAYVKVKHALDDLAKKQMLANVADNAQHSNKAVNSVMVKFNEWRESEVGQKKLGLK